MWKHLVNIKTKLKSHLLTKAHPYKALLRYIKWQCYYRFISEKRIINWVTPLKIQLKKDAPSINAQYYFGLADFSEMSFTIHFLREQDLFIDIGAYQGVYSLLAAGISKAEVIAFEPEQKAFSQLKYHIELNQLKNNIDCRQTALGEQIKKTTITTNYSQQNYIEPNSHNSVNILMSTLNEEIPEIEVACLIKIDAEGYELKILEGGKNILQNKNLKAIIIEMMNLGIRYGSNDQQVHELLINSGFHLYQYDPYKRELLPLNQLINGNGIYIKDIEFVKQRVKHAKPFKVLGKNI